MMTIEFIVLATALLALVAAKVGLLLVDARVQARAQPGTRRAASAQMLPTRGEWTGRSATLCPALPQR